MVQRNKLAGLLLMMTYLFISGCGTTKLPQNITVLKPEIGKVLPPWQQGYLDIHAINTGRGESALCIFPDGTTMLVDAAGSLISPNDAIPPPPQKPNVNVASGDAITNYVNHFVKPASGKLNYIMLSHFDPDHMGTWKANLPVHSSGNFKMGGVTEVGAKIKFDKILDRDYPNYNFPTDKTADPRVKNYIDFINWAKKEYNAKAEQFVAGRNDQVVLTQDPQKYPNFEVRNVVSNGYVWAGKGTGAVNFLPKADEIVAAKAKENILSSGFTLSYGKFNYFSAGDLQYNDRDAHAWKDMESPVAKVVQSVDVLKANHHGTAHCNSDELLSKLTPKVVVVHAWRDVHPNPATVSRMFDANQNCEIFSTNMSEANKTRLAEQYPKLKGMNGHVVVRVAPGGDKYYVYMLDDTNMDYKVTNMYGPYTSN